MKRILFHILALLLVISSLNAQDVTVNASFDTSKIFIGDQTGFTISIDQPSGIRLKLPLLKDTLVHNIEILKGPVLDTVKADGRFKVRQKYIITSFDSGYYRIPPVYAEISGDSIYRRFYSDYSQLEVMRVGIAPPDTTAKIFDIVAPYDAPITFAEILPWLLAGIVSLAAVFFLVRFLKKVRKEENIPVTITHSEPAHVIAFRELQRLSDEKLWQKGEIKKYYTRLTEILRQYLENRYGILSLELTTYETLRALIDSGFKKDESYSMLESVLRGGDLVKFAKYKPSAEENELHFQTSYRFVELTREPEKTESTNEDVKHVEEAI